MFLNLLFSSFVALCCLLSNYFKHIFQFTNSLFNCVYFIFNSSTFLKKLFIFGFAGSLLLWWAFSICSKQGNPLQCSCLENPRDRGAWGAAVHGVAKSQTGLSDFAFTFHFHALEKEMATHSSVLAWRIPGTGEPGGVLSLGSHRVGHDWSDLATTAAGPEVNL